MKRTILSLAALALAAGLAACQRQDTAAERAEAPAPMPMEEMQQGMPMQGATMAQGTGTVTAVNEAEGTVTIDHAPIAEAGWPQMTMAFKAPPEAVRQVKPGDKVAFDLRLQGGSGEITAMRKQ